MVVTGFVHLKQLPGNAKKKLIILSICKGQSVWRNVLVNKYSLKYIMIPIFPLLERIALYELDKSPNICEF